MTIVDRIERQCADHWLRWVLLAWLATALWLLWARWDAIHWLALSDTDDNLRFQQVRDWLAGQGWFDLRQYRLNPPQGFDIHWSRLVDLPLAALMLVLKPLLGAAWGERMAAAIAPMLPLGLIMAALAVTVRRLVDPRAWPLAIVFLLGAGSAMVMVRPLRVDHHGWQLAMLALTLAGLTDPRRARGGVIVGLATAFSLVIGLELLPFAAMAGAIVALRWVWDAADARRLLAYAISLGGGTALGYAAFTSYANRVPRCDALTPVWLSVMLVAAALALILAYAPARTRGVRLALAAVAGAIVAGFFVLAWPQCLGRLEGVSPELAELWLNNVREAKPVYEHPLRMALPIVALPVVGLIGAILSTILAWRSDRFASWAPVALFVAFACGMLLWQTRAGAAAQLLAVPGAVALAWIALPWSLAHRNVLIRGVGTLVIFLGVSGVFAQLAISWLPIDRPSAYAQTVNRANARCPFVTNLAPLNRLPAQTVFTHSDLGPRLIVTTRHRAIAGPYHRNGDAILDVHHAFDGSPADFRRIARAHGATLLLICPMMAETTLYRQRAPNGFYARLADGQRFDFLDPLPLPAGSPLRLYRIR